MNASSEHVYDSDKEAKCRENKFDMNRKFKQLATIDKESVSSSYLSLSGSSMSYVSVDGTGTLSDISSGFLSVAENHDYECDEICNGGNNCFLCSRNDIEVKATHMCKTCRAEKKFICYKCLQLHNTFCEEHDVISLTVKCEQQTEPYSNSSDEINVEQDFTYNSYDQSVQLEATSIHLPLTYLSNQKDKMKESGKKTLNQPATMDHKKDSEYQQTIPTTNSVIPSTDSPDKLKHTFKLMPTCAKPVVFSTEYVPLGRLDKASQTDFSDEMKHSSVQMCAKDGLSELLSTDSKRSNFTCELEKKKLRVPGSLGHFRNKNKRNQCHFQTEAELEEEYRNIELEVGQEVPNVIINSTSAARKLKGYEFASRQANPKRDSSAETTTEPFVHYFNTFSNERISISGLNLNFTIEEPTDIANSSDCDSLFEDVKIQMKKQLLKKGYGGLFIDTEPLGEYLFPLEESNQRQQNQTQNVTNAYGNTDVACGIGKHIVKHKRNECHIQKTLELKKGYLYDDGESCLVKTLAFTRFIQQLPPEDVARIFQKLDSKDLSECSEILVALKSGDEIKVLQSVSERCKSKPSYRLSVVTAEVFEEALRQCQIYEYDHTYSNYFPRDCRMFIGIPVYKGGFINRRDNKDRGIGP